MGARTEDGARRGLRLLISSMSAAGRSVSAGPEVARILRAGGWRVQAVVTTSSDAPDRIAGDCDEEVVAAIGGDGYLSAVARGCHDAGRVFAPIPGGRGNDLCRALGIGTDPRERARSLAPLGLAGASSDGEFDGRKRSLDGIWVDSADGLRLVLGIVSLGVDAQANIRANESSLNYGPLAYAYGAIAAFSRYRHIPVRGIVDGVERDLTGWLASISNSGRFGGGITLVPQSDPFDGVLELCHARAVSRWTALPVLARALGGRAADGDIISIEEARRVEVVQPVGMPVMADGDRVARVPFVASVAPGAVTVLV
ncbi:diacylglycerol kinase [Actinomyces sp. B33]|uniref:diacylglycerol/lipid kinase family protein n=1 Tax=Actinomyces sp. B33 TaxID=2942131 RepID=UPI002341786D|nr:diacylglycerol kinase family protein [Actinomyces sp. B33]MDC4232779.1 diacylglycerol kinase [Actinomyces sp. B33]